jgi:tetratricopeptide (TPR) repeat protein
MCEPARSLDATQRSLALFEQMLPQHHPHLALLQVNVAMASRSLGDLGTARRAAERAVEIDRVVLGDDHPELAGDLHGLGAVELRLGRFDAARAAFSEGLRIINGALGDDHFGTTLHRASLGNVALAEGNPAKALEHLDPVLDLLAASDDSRAPRHAIGYLRQRAIALRQLGRLDDAAAAVSSAGQLIEQLDHEIERPSFALIGALIALDSGEITRATALFDQAVELGGCTFESLCLLDLADTAVLRAHWHTRRGEIDAAFRTLELALEHTRWTGWILDSNDLGGLRQPEHRGRWRDLTERLDTRIETALKPAD